MGLASMIAISRQQYLRQGMSTATPASATEDAELGVTQNAGAEKIVRSATEKITAFIPSDVIGIYVAGLGLFAPTTPKGKWWIFGVGMALIPVFLVTGYFIEKKKEKKSTNRDRTSGEAHKRQCDFLVLGVLAELAFVSWAAAFPESPFAAVFGTLAPKIAAFAMVILAAVMPQIASIFNLVPPNA